MFWIHLLVRPHSRRVEMTSKKTILVTGGHGFIGSHIARRLYQTNHVRIVDLAPMHCLDPDVPISHEFILGNLCDADVCRRAVEDVDVVLHFAANMGGMGTIHEGNDLAIYEDNHTMTINLLNACVQADVKIFFYASSACVYPESLQDDPSRDVSLREVDAWSHSSPEPQGLYGLEKLYSEVLVQRLALASKMTIRIARFHNVYGPGGAWRNGREKVPAALLRKAFAAKLLGDSPQIFELWGDGSQRRSFLYIDDAVEGVIKLLESSCDIPVNIGSDDPVSIKNLADMALGVAGVALDGVRFNCILGRPVGVASRNSNNDFVTSRIHWTPNISLEAGMKHTGKWIAAEMKKATDLFDNASDARRSLLEEFQKSEVVNLDEEKVVFAILLPITSRGSTPPDDCLSNLTTFTHSLCRTTWRDTHSQGGKRYAVKVYLAIDHDDEFLLSEGQGRNKAEMVLRNASVNVKTLIRNHPPGHVCALWRDCAREAWEDGCDYMTLLGDDVTLADEGWMRDVDAEFSRLSSAHRVPVGFGCVAFTDTSFPGMPTFPIIHRTHMDIFSGEVVPDVFVNQDGDPFLYQLYRRWSCSSMIRSRISNGVGGSDQARYEKQHAKDWTFNTLDTAVERAELWLRKQHSSAERHLTLDVIIPCYRVDLKILAPILDLKPSSTCTVMFIIIIDNHDSPYGEILKYRYAHRADVRIRTNKTNLGASESRNRGMRESSADWVHFLDDDVVPSSDLLVEAEKVIRAHPIAAGFVGTALFPVAETVFTTAVHLAGVTYFWDIATKIEDDLPWGVTANLIARRNKDGVEYDQSYPKTGGGEDIEFCRRKRQFAIENGGDGFIAAPDVVVTHPYWNGGARSYWRFYMWSVGDGALVERFPNLTYFDIAPNSAELMLLCIIGITSAFACASWSWALFSLELFMLVILANVMHDCYRHLWKHPERYDGLNCTLKGIWWFMAVVESSFIRMFSEAGRLRGLLGRGEVNSIQWRFDWFAGRAGDGPQLEERRNAMQRLLLVVFLVGFIPL